MKDESFKTGIAYLQKIYGKKIDDDVYKNYWGILKDYSDEEFKKMLENIAKTFIPTSQVPFPLIPHFLGAIGAAGASKSQLAVMAVKTALIKYSAYDTVSFGDSAIHETIRQLGGWIEFCNLPSDWWQFNEKRFIQIYEAAQIYNSGINKLCGIFELENAGKNISKWTGTQRKITEKQNYQKKQNGKDLNSLIIKKKIIRKSKGLNK
jgi:hypothetical protein